MAGFDATPGTGQRGCSKWMVYAGAAGVMAMMLFLVASTRVVERGLDGLARRACTRLLQRLPLDLAPAERARTERNLRLLSSQLRRGEVEGRVVGEFLSRASEALEDGRLTTAEVGTINRLLDGLQSAVESTPVPSRTPGPAATPPAG